MRGIDGVFYHIIGERIGSFLLGRSKGAHAEIMNEKSDPILGTDSYFRKSEQFRSSA